MRRDTGRIAILVACLLALGGGCAQRRAQQMQAYQQQQQAQQQQAQRAEQQRSGYGSAGGESQAAARSRGPEAASLSDAEIAKILETVNRGEVDQAELAITKAEDPEVRDYAQRMRDEHRRALQRGEQLAATLDTPPTPSALDQQLEGEGQRTMAELEAAQGAAFDRKYLDTQVAMHRKVLELIDGVLLPSVQSAELRAEIQAVRPVIASHLDHAQRIEASGG